VAESSFGQVINRVTETKRVIAMLKPEIGKTTRVVG